LIQGKKFVFGIDRVRNESICQETELEEQDFLLTWISIVGVNKIEDLKFKQETIVDGQTYEIWEAEYFETICNTITSVALII
jgi:hypothetical protein